MQNELVCKLVRKAREAGRDARDANPGDSVWSYYRGLRRGFMSAARFAKHAAKSDSFAMKGV